MFNVNLLLYIMVLVFASTPDGKVKKNAQEAVTYAYRVAQATGSQVVALTLGSHVENASQLGKYGANRVLNVGDARLNSFDSQVYANVICQIADQIGATVVCLSHDSFGKSLVGRIAARLGAGSVPGANSTPIIDGASFRVKKNVFSGKAVAEIEIKSDRKVLSVMGNTFPPAVVGTDVPVEQASATIPTGRITVKESKTITGTVPLTEAELVVSAGRGMKGPENWGIVEDLAQALGAATACSRPVADVHWRPHHEHVGQTGVAIRPNLYIAIGISGAIQHLAGVNQSKVIVVINKDIEAPFFKAADYGICGDLFEVLPRLTAAIKKYKEQQ